jgi:hypothetical protein
MSDYAQMMMLIDERESDPLPDLIVTFRDRTIARFEEVSADPVRYQGSWSILHEYLGRAACSYLLAEDVLFFTLLEKPEGGR